MSLDDRIAESADNERIHFLDTPEHPGAISLAAYWNEKRGSRAMPDRQDIVPSEIVRLLPNIQISEALDGGRDFRIRLFGTALVAMLGGEMTGRRLSELGNDPTIIVDPQAARHRWFEIMGRSYSSGRPVFATGYLTNTVRRNVSWHAVSAPMTVGGGGGTAQLLGGLFFVEQS